MNDPKVSILIPLYNSEEYIAETIDSCLKQTYENIEIIIVDDESTDSSLDIAKEYENKHANIKVEAQKNSGAPVARNRAFALSTGEYIQYIDADDLLHPDKIRLQIEVLKNSDDLTIVFGKYGYFIKTIENIDWKDLPVNKNYNDPKQFLLNLWENGVAIIPHLWLIPRKLIEESGGWDESLVKNQDGEFFSRVVFIANKVFFVENSIGYYRRDNLNSISRQVSRKAFEAKLQSFETYVNLMKEDLDKLEVRRSLALVYSRNIYYMRYNYPEYEDLIQKAEEKIKFLGFKRPLITRNKIEYLLMDSIGLDGLSYLKKIIKTIIKPFK
ncbi:glycosyltransferase family 2 protein [Sulfurovum sp. CS9]|uniref:glycosyltransferase family 2 protein n=1 Tax=Sulfurovum sp. CS9 TaxID=3391146 RepID=UPI0039EC74CB